MKITVPMLHPGQNEMRRKYRSPFAYMRLRDSWESTIYMLVPSRWRIDSHNGRWPLGDGRLHICVTLYHKHAIGKRKQQLFDPDNVSVKVILDSLQRLRFIADDSTDHIDLEVKQDVADYGRDAFTEITIEPV